MRERACSTQRGPLRFALRKAYLFLIAGDHPSGSHHRLGGVSPDYATPRQPWSHGLQTGQGPDRNSHTADSSTITSDRRSDFRPVALIAWLQTVSLRHVAARGTRAWPCFTRATRRRWGRRYSCTSLHERTRQTRLLKDNDDHPDDPQDRAQGKRLARTEVLPLANHSRNGTADGPDDNERSDAHEPPRLFCARILAQPADNALDDAI